ncbi:MAG: phage tail protein, partial [Chitinophagaceae bacterium]
SVKPIAEAGEAIALFGRGSMLARMVAAFKKADRYSEVHAIALDDIGGGSAASGTITVTGPATAPGTIALLIAGVAVPVAVATGAIANDIAAAIAAAINAKADLPVTAAAAAAVVTVTCRHKGTVGNSIDIRHSHFAGEALPAGVALAIVAMAAGATDPDLATVWPVIGDNAYRTIVIGLTDATTVAAAKAELDDRWGPLRMLESVAYGAKSGTQGALAAFGAALNSELVSVLGTGKSPTWPAEAAAIWGAICGYYTAIDPARPLQTLTLTGLVAPKEADRFTRAQRDLLLRDGISTFTVDQGGTARVERA